MKRHRSLGKDIGQHGRRALPANSDRIVAGQHVDDLGQGMVPDHSAHRERGLPWFSVPFRKHIVTAGPACSVTHKLGAAVGAIVTVSEHPVHIWIRPLHSRQGAKFLIELLEKQKDRIAGIDLGLEIFESKSLPG